MGLEDAEDLVAGDDADLGNAVGVTEDDTDLGRGGTLLGEPEKRYQRSVFLARSVIANYRSGIDWGPLRFARCLDVPPRIRPCSSIGCTHLQICSSTWAGVVLSHAGAVREYGSAEAEIPFPLE